MKQRGRRSAAALAIVPAPPPEPVWTAPPPPESLGPAGAGLWQRLVDAYQFEPGELELLALAAAAHDRAEGLRNQIDQDGAVQHGEGAPRAHDAIRHETQARALSARLLARLGVL